MNSWRGCSSVLRSRGSLVCVSKGDRALQLFDCLEWKGSSQQGPCQARAPKPPLQPEGRAGSPWRSPPWTWKWKTKAPGSLTKNLPKVGLGWLCGDRLASLAASWISHLFQVGFALFPFTKQHWNPWQFKAAFQVVKRACKELKGLAQCKCKNNL